MDAHHAIITKATLPKIRKAPRNNKEDWPAEGPNDDDLQKDVGLSLDSIFDEPARPPKRGNVEDEVTYYGDSKRAKSRGEAAPTVNVDNQNKVGIVKCAAGLAIANHQNQNKVT